MTGVSPATTKDKIKQASSTIKIREIGQNNEPLRETLIYIFALIGLREPNLPSQAETIVLFCFIRKELNRFSLEEMRLAFELAAAGKLRTKIDHFQNFNAVYISNVMSAFESEKMRIAAEEASVKTKEEPVVTDSKKEEIEKEYIETILKPSFEFYKRSGITEIPPGMSRVAYKVLHKLGFANLLTASPELRRGIEEEAMVLLKEEELTRVDSLESFRKNKFLNESKEEMKRAFCYYVLVGKIFEKMLQEGKEI